MILSAMPPAFGPRVVLDQQSVSGLTVIQQSLESVACTIGLLIVPSLILLIFTGLLEELIFRAVLQYFAVRHLGKLGFLYVSLVFAVSHIGYLSILDFGFVFLVAMIFSYFVQRTGSILGVTMAHGLTNIGLFLIFPHILGG